MANNILTAEEVALRTRICKRRVYELARKREIPAFRYPGSRLYFFRSSEIDDWISSLNAEGRPS